MLAMLEEGDWRDAKSNGTHVAVKNPYHRKRRIKQHVIRFRTTLGLLFKIGTIALVFLCSSLQIKTFRTLTIEQTNDSVHPISSSMQNSSGKSAGVHLTPPKVKIVNKSHQEASISHKPNRKLYHKPIPISSEGSPRKFGTGLLDRIKEEKLRTKEEKVRSDTAIRKRQSQQEYQSLLQKYNKDPVQRTRVTGKAVSQDVASWPVLRRHQSNEKQSALKQELYESLVGKYAEAQGKETATRTRILRDNANLNNNLNPNQILTRSPPNWPILNSQDAAPSGTILYTGTKDATATHTRIKGAPDAASKRLIWPVLNASSTPNTPNTLNALNTPNTTAATAAASQIYSGSVTEEIVNTDTEMAANEKNSTAEPSQQQELQEHKKVQRLLHRPLLHQPHLNSEPKLYTTYKIIGFSDYNYRDVALKWYQRLSDLGYNEHVLIAYDNAMADYLQSLNEELAYHLAHEKSANTTSENIVSNDDSSNKKYFYRFEKHLLPPLPKKVLKLRRAKRHRKGREMIFAWRWHYILEQLQAGTSVLLTDVDTIFNQYIDLSKHPDFAKYDVMHAYEGRSPGHIFEKIGFTVNGGMNWLQATPSCIAFVRKLVEACGAMCDDQVVLNEMIADPQVLGIEWDSQGTEEFLSNGENDRDDNFEKPKRYNDESFNEDDENQSELLNLPLPSQARIGRSTVTGHTIKIWDRDWVFRGDQNNPRQCPSNGSDTWIAMPFPDPDMFKRKLTRGSSIKYKLAMFDAWDTGCGQEQQKARE